jgi:pyrroline-5-carboxylate reductase
MNAIACIGSGNMGYALMKGAYSAAPEISLVFTDTDIKKAKAAADALKGKALTSNTEAAKMCDLVFLAVKPQVLPQVLAEISQTVKDRAGNPPTIISMAAGWSIEHIQDALGAKIPVVRIMPNTPSLICKGMIVMSASSEVPADVLTKLEKLLSGAGTVDIIDECYMDAVTGLSGSGPAFAYIFIEALADGGVLAGLPRDKALRYAVQTVLGAAVMVQETGKHPGELKDMVTSPGGTTIAGIAALENAAFRGGVIGAVEAAWERAVELG